MKKILLIGNGAREHALGETLKRYGATVYTYGKARNPGLLELSEKYEIGSLADFRHIQEFARNIHPDFAFIGPDDPIGDGLADALLESDIPSVAPLKTVARLESSKSFTREILSKYNIPGNPIFKVFFEEKGIADFIHALDGNYVVKADGLMGGKGVKVSGEHLATVEEGLEYARECLQESGRVVIEEKFIGSEFSLMSFCDGITTVEMPAVQDHKRAYEGDLGPNTGGMGTYSDYNHLLPFLSHQDIQQARNITEQVAAALVKETGSFFKGIMYGGFMATAQGVRLIEYNARFGDPEAENALPILNTNFIHICEAIISQDLKNLPINFLKKATVCKYIVPEWYPEHSVRNGERIEIGKLPENVKLYYSSVDMADGAIYLGSSRALALVGIADSLPEAEKLAEEGCQAIRGPVYHRKDIGSKDLIQKRVDLMKRLRSNKQGG